MELKAMTLEDGEQVIRLRGGARGAKWKSDLPHSGVWGEGVGYVLVPTRHPRRRVSQALAFEPGLTDRSSAGEVLLLGGRESIERLITEGPNWCRARRRVSRSPESAHHLAAFRYQPRRNREPASSGAA